MSVPPDGRFTYDVPVRFRDIDLMGHAHHTLPLIYVEEARAAFWRMLKDSPSFDDIDYVMAETTVRFHARIRFPSTVTVSLAVRHVGEKSFSMEFEVLGEDGTLLSSGSAVQVAYDYEGNRSKPINASDRDVLVQWRDAAVQPIKIESAADTVPIIPPRT